MPDMQKVLATKERILDIIRTRGPELPVRIANKINLSNIFTAAFMSELVAEQRLKISHMRVGSSPLYYIQGQEEQLQKYIDYLNHKEKEAFRLLKEHQVLQDAEQEPAIRVALRSIKDFATPMQIVDKGETKIFWKIHTLSIPDAKAIIEQKLNPVIEKPIQVAPVLQTLTREVKSELPQTTQALAQAPEPVKKLKDNLSIFAPSAVKKIQVPLKPIKPVDSPFLSSIRTILTDKNFEILAEHLVKKKEFAAKIRTDTHLGKQEFYLVAKDKKKITADDLAITLQKAQVEKMPALILSPGDIDKKAHDYYREWRNLIRHEKVKL